MSNFYAICCILSWGKKGVGSWTMKYRLIFVTHIFTHLTISGDTVFFFYYRDPSHTFVTFICFEMSDCSFIV